MDPREIRKRVDSSDWRVSPYRNAARPLYTYDDIVSDSFSSVKQLGRGANHCRLEEMYNPFDLGSLRRSRSYSALAPTYGMRYSDWHVAPDLRPYKPYQPKQNEYKLEMQKSQIGNRQLPANITTSSALPPLAPMHRRQYAVPAHKTRFENFAIYWGGRARGLDYSQPFLHEPPRDTYEIMEDRRQLSTPVLVSPLYSDSAKCSTFKTNYVDRILIAIVFITQFIKTQPPNTLTNQTS